MVIKNQKMQEIEKTEEVVCTKQCKIRVLSVSVQ